MHNTQNTNRTVAHATPRVVDYHGREAITYARQHGILPHRTSDGGRDGALYDCPLSDAEDVAEFEPQRIWIEAIVGEHADAATLAERMARRGFEDADGREVRAARLGLLAAMQRDEGVAAAWRAAVLLCSQMGIETGRA